MWKASYRPGAPTVDCYVSEKQPRLCSATEILGFICFINPPYPNTVALQGQDCKEEMGPTLQICLPRPNVGLGM